MEHGYRYKYSIHGPFEVIRKKTPKGKVLLDTAPKAKNKFWDDVETEVPDLPNACGCYLFAIKTKGFKPWYVGLAEKQKFKKECFGYHKINIYKDVLDNCGKGTPYLFFIAKRTKKKDDFAKPSKRKKGRPDIQYLETLLIGTAIVKNPGLKNKMKTKYLINMSVPGLINTPHGKQSGQASKFKMAIK
jgi:hypothetical protein